MKVVKTAAVGALCHQAPGAHAAPAGTGPAPLLPLTAATDLAGDMPVATIHVRPAVPETEPSLPDIIATLIAAGARKAPGGGASKRVFLLLGEGHCYGKNQALVNDVVEAALRDGRSVSFHRELEAPSREEQLPATQFLDRWEGLRGSPEVIEEAAELLSLNINCGTAGPKEDEQTFKALAKHEKFSAKSLAFLVPERDDTKRAIGSKADVSILSSGFRHALGSIVARNQVRMRWLNGEQGSSVLPKGYHHLSRQQQAQMYGALDKARQAGQAIFICATDALYGAVRGMEPWQARDQLIADYLEKGWTIAEVPWQGTNVTIIAADLRDTLLEIERDNPAVGLAYLDEPRHGEL